MQADKAARAQMIHRFEQMAAGLSRGNKAAETQARAVIGTVALEGSIDILHDVIAGVLLMWDKEQPKWDKMKL